MKFADITFWVGLFLLVPTLMYKDSNPHFAATIGVLALICATAGFAAAVGELPAFDDE